MGGSYSVITWFLSAHCDGIKLLLFKYSLFVVFQIIVQNSAKFTFTFSTSLAPEMFLILCLWSKKYALALIESSDNALLRLFLGMPIKSCRLNCIVSNCLSKPLLFMLVILKICIFFDSVTLNFCLIDGLELPISYKQVSNDSEISSTSEKRRLIAVPVATISLPQEPVEILEVTLWAWKRCLAFRFWWYWKSKTLKQSNYRFWFPGKNYLHMF